MRIMITYMYIMLLQYIHVTICYINKSRIKFQTINELDWMADVIFLALLPRLLRIDRSRNQSFSAFRFPWMSDDLRIAGIPINRREKGESFARGNVSYMSAFVSRMRQV